MLALAIDAIFTANQTAYEEASLGLLGIFGTPGVYPQYQGSEALQGIRCGDTSLRTDHVTDLLPTLQRFREASSITGDSQSNSIFLSCAAWKMQAKERYTGGFKNIKPRKPLLFVGSPHDPLTPLPSAQNVSAAFEESVVLQHNGYGHASVSQPSLCTARSIRDYFVNGTLPKPGTVCEPSVPIFRDATADLLSIVTPLNGTTKRSVVEEADDADVLAALTTISSRMSSRRPLM